MKIVIATGAGISAPSGIRTFRGEEGVWKTNDPLEVEKDPVKQEKFWNELFAELEGKEPNLAHEAIAELEKNHDVTVVTQNIDDLHEKAGSTKIIHLHGSCHENDVVMFGSSVKDLDKAIEAVVDCEMFVSIGTSDLVSPANTLISYTPLNCDRILVNTEPTVHANYYNAMYIGCATETVPRLIEIIEENEDLSEMYSK